MIRTVDFAAIEKSGADEYLTQALFDHTTHKNGYALIKTALAL